MKKKSNRETHGLRHHFLYRTWDCMMQRCNNPKSTSYKHYGFRGIKVSEEFKDCKLFIDYISSLENFENKELYKLQLDRINNNGNYEKGNLKWSTPVENSCNKRVRNDSTTKYTGISKVKDSYRIYIFVNKKYTHLGFNNNLKKCIEIRNKYIIDNNLPHKLQNSILTAYPLDNIK